MGVGSDHKVVAQDRERMIQAKAKASPVRRLGGREQGRTQYPISLVTRCHRTKVGGPHHGKAV